MLDAIIFRLEVSASSLFRLMDRRVAGSTGEPDSVRECGADRGERCAASRAFNGSSPTANLVSIIKGQKDVVGTDSSRSEGTRRASQPRLSRIN